MDIDIARFTYFARAPPRAPPPPSPLQVPPGGEPVAGRRASQWVPLTRAPLARRRWRAGRGLYSIIDRLKNFNVHAGFVLEGTADDELPELILGAGRWPFADHSQLATFGA